MVIDWGNKESVAAATLEEITNSIERCLYDNKGELLRPATNDLKDIVEEVSANYVGRKEAVEFILASLISGVPIVLMGAPGLAKSAIVRDVVKKCGGSDDNGDYFEYLLTNHTMPENIFGPPDLALLQEGTMRVNTARMLPRASVAFLDEVFRGSPHILNTLLAVINERKFHNGPLVEDVPLIGVIGASNDLTINPELEAFIDRFPIRHWMESVIGEGDDIEQNLLKVSLKKSLPVKEEAISSLNMLRGCQAYINFKSMELAENPDSFRVYKEAFLCVRDQCRISDRSFSSIFKIGCALDVLRGFEDGGGPVEMLKHCGPDLETSRRAKRAVSNIQGDEGFCDAEG